MKRKQGISLIVLVITIIVMIILAASVVITLSNSGIIDKANTAVEATNKKTVEQLASIIWLEEYMEGKRGETLKEAVLDKLEDYNSEYTITVTDDGITVESGNGKELNEYGFYYDTPYVQTGHDVNYGAVVFKEDGIAEFYYYPEDGKQCIWDGNSEATYEKGKIAIDDWILKIGDKGNTLIDSDDSNYTMKATNIEYRGKYYNERYYLIDDIREYIVFSEDNTLTGYYYNEENYTVAGSTMTEANHRMASSYTGDRWYISMDGRTIMDTDRNAYFLVRENEILISGDCIGSHTCKVDEGMTWEQWVNSSYNTLGIIIDDQGHVVPTCCSEHQTGGALITYGITGSRHYISTSDDLVTGIAYTTGIFK